MTDHLSTLQVEQLCVSALPEDELAAAAVHTAKCQSCHQRFVQELRRQRNSVPFTFTLEPKFWFRDDHVDFELLVALADKTLDRETEEIVHIHLQTCETCREDVRSFLASREITASEMEVSYGPTYRAPAVDITGAPWWQRMQSRPVYAVAAIVLAAVLVVIGAVALNKKSGSLEAGKHEQANSHIEQSPGISSSPEPNVASSPGNVDDSARVAILKDGGGEVTIDKDGRVTGLDEVSDNSRQYIARAALSEHIDPAEVLRRLSGDQSSLRGSDNGNDGLRLLYPVRSVVIEDRPTFRWESIAGTSSYRVYVLDSKQKQVGQSEDLPPNRTRWIAPSRLRRGQVYSWIVTAMVDGKKVVSPSASAPEMKFAVLSAADFEELTRLKKSTSHLALGVFYARAGLLNEAEGEFRSLGELNPQAALPRKLLQSVRNTKRGN
jgi:hypothetical protein